MQWSSKFPSLVTFLKYSAILGSCCCFLLPIHSVCHSLSAFTYLPPWPEFLQLCYLHTTLHKQREHPMLLRVVEGTLQRVISLL